MGRPSTRSELAVPVCAGGRLIGAMNLESDEPRAYSEEDAEPLRLFADAAAIAVEKAVLYRLFVQRERLEEELRGEVELQAAAGSAVWRDLPGWDAVGYTRPRYEIGGDYYDRIPLGDGRLGLVVADVSGKGSLAAMTVATFRAILRAQVDVGGEPVRTATAANRLLRERVRPTEYVTAVWGVLDPARGLLSYTNCGHVPPLLVRADGSYTRLTTGGPPLGLLASARYLSGEVSIGPGDLLLLFTDGVVESEGPAEAEYGADRLAEAARDGRGLPSAELVEAIVRSVAEFRGADEPTDDFTLLVLKRTGEAASPPDVRATHRTPGHAPGPEAP